MQIVRKVGMNAVAKLEPEERFEQKYKYGVIFNYDESKEYIGMDCVVVKETLNEAVSAAQAWC